MREKPRIRCGSKVIGNLLAIAVHAASRILKRLPGFGGSQALQLLLDDCPPGSPVAPASSSNQRLKSFGKPMIRV